jgi:hypothetical protein
MCVLLPLSCLRSHPPPSFKVLAMAIFWGRSLIHLLLTRIDQRPAESFCIHASAFECYMIFHAPVAGHDLTPSAILTSVQMWFVKYFFAPGPWHSMFRFTGRCKASDTISSDSDSCCLPHQASTITRMESLNFLCPRNSWAPLL